MQTVSRWEFAQMIEQIYREQPAYELGKDGSGGKCDCIGMVRGALQRAGATEISHMGGTNDAARNAIQDLRLIIGDSQLRVGDVVLKTRSPDDKDYPLPDKYRKGGAAYSGDEKNYIHIGTVTGVYPLEITHMTSPTAKKDSKLGNWLYVGKLPWVRYGDEEKEGSQVTGEQMVTWANNGSPINLRAARSTAARLIDQIPLGENVTAEDEGDGWSWVHWNGKAGYVKSQFLKRPGETAGGELPREKIEEIYHQLGKILGLE